MRYYKMIDRFAGWKYTKVVFSCTREDFKHYDEDARLEAGYDVELYDAEGNCVCPEDADCEDDTITERYYFWKAGWEDELELEWFDDEDDALARLEQYMKELEEESEKDCAAVLEIEKGHSQDWDEFRKALSLNRDGSWKGTTYAEVFDTAFSIAEEEGRDGLLQKVNRRTMKVRQALTETAIDRL